MIDLAQHNLHSDSQPELPEPKRDELGRSYATGKRKDAVARVWIKPGSGRIFVNGKEMKDYFARPVLQMILRQPFQIAGAENLFDVVTTVKGGGLSGQAGAVKHGDFKGAPALRALLQAAAQGSRFPDPRFPSRRAKEIRQAQSPSKLPVLEALSFFTISCIKAALLPLFYFILCFIAFPKM